MNKTKIEYLDRTLNILVGCSGKNCAVKEHCYAEAGYKRNLQHCQWCRRFVPHIHRERLVDRELESEKFLRIGLNFTGDTFDSYMHPDWIREILEMLKNYPQHIFVMLTKQPQNIPEWFFRRAPSNLALGVSVNWQNDVWRLEHLLGNHLDSSRWRPIVSFEPLYEDLKVHLKGLSWVIIGSQTKPTLLPNPEWVTNIIEQSRTLSIPVFLKNNLGWSERLQEYSEALELVA